MERVVFAVEGKKFSIVGQHVPENDFSEFVADVTDGVEYLECRMGKRNPRTPGLVASQQKLFRFLPRKLGEHFVTFKAHSNKSVVGRARVRVYVRRRNATEIVVPPPKKISTVTTVEQGGVVEVDEGDVEVRPVLRINGIDIDVPDDFVDCLQQLVGHGGIKVEELLADKLMRAGLMERGRRDAGGDYATPELRRGFPAIRLAVRSATGGIPVACGRR